jgi:hypothetical protein
MQKEGLIFKAESDHPWLYRCKIGWQSRIVVVCRDLPIESVISIGYFLLLLVAQSGKILLKC